MDKKEIITIIKNIEPELDKEVFIGEERPGKSSEGIGCNQFRELAGICRRAECYDEVELLVLYNKSKAKPGNSWNRVMKGGKKTLADIIVSCMRTIREQSDDDNVLNELSLFFGYLYWNSRIWAAENKAADNRSEHKDCSKNIKKGYKTAVR